jgi:hypothetical protein
MDGLHALCANDGGKLADEHPITLYLPYVSATLMPTPGHDTACGGEKRRPQESDGPMAGMYTSGAWLDEICLPFAVCAGARTSRGADAVLRR